MVKAIWDSPVERLRHHDERREPSNAVMLSSRHRPAEALGTTGAQRRMTKPEGLPEKAKRGGAAMGRGTKDIGDQIGRELRGMFDEVLSQPVPDRFLDLLNKLETNTITSQANQKPPGDV